MVSEEIGTVISGLEGPSPSGLDLVIHVGKLHRGQYVEIDYSEGTMVCLVTNVFKTNRYFERFESVKEFESSGFKLFEQFPAGEWEYLVAKTRPLGIYQNGLIKRATFPPSPGTKARIASRGTLEKFLGFDLEKGLLLGEIEHHDVPVKLNLSRLFQKHLAILAMSGAGKCVSGDSKVLLANGTQKTISGIVDPVLEKNKTIENGVESWQGDSGLSVFAFSEGKIKPAKIQGFYRRKSPEFLVCMETRTGRRLELTPEHFVPVFGGSLEWKKAGELKPGEYVILPRVECQGADTKMDFSATVKGLKAVIVSGGYAEQKQSKKRVPLVHEVDEKFARLFAYLLAEGHNTLKSRVTFTNENAAIRADFASIFSEKFGLILGNAKAKGEFYFDSSVLAKCLAGFGFTKSSWTKFVPVEIPNSRKSVLENFLAALIDCDGYVSPKKPEIDITLASPKLIDGIDEILTKLGVVSLRRSKWVGGKEYRRLLISGSGEIKKLASLNLLVDYKAAALRKWAASKSNTNIDIVPNLDGHFREILRLLRMPTPQGESTGINNYLHRKDCPSRENLLALIRAFEKRADVVEFAVAGARQLSNSIPAVSEAEALEIVKHVYSDGANFKTIASGSGVSATTARRMVRGITTPTHSAFRLAQNAQKMLLAESQSELAADFRFNGILKEIKEICEKLGHSSVELCLGAGCHPRFLYAHANGRGTPLQPTIVALADKLKVFAEKSAEDLLQARARIGVLRQALEMNAFFDTIKSVEMVGSKHGYVYDLSVENSNFVANNILVHNSYLVSVLLEELLERRKEDGRIAVIVMDAHGEYRSFAEPVKGNAHVDFSSMSRFIKASEVQIGVPKLSAAMMAMMVPGISAPQKRDLGKVLEKLRQGMKGGLGPYDFGAVKQEISRDAEIKPATKETLIGWILTLEQMRLFGKTDNPSISDLVKPGQLTIVDLSDVIDLKKKQVIVAYFARKLFDERRQKRVPPFTMVVEESHQFAPEKAPKEGSISKHAIELIAREGRKFGAGICLVSQRPKHLSTTALSQANTHIILRITNPYDLDHIKQTSEGIDQGSLDMITSLRTGEALMVGEAVNYPVFFKVRKRLSQASRHETTLEKSAVDFEETREASSKDLEDLL